MTRQSESLSHWDLSESHRGIVTELVCSEAPPHDGRLCILGAGQCNEIDLGLLLEKFSRITLVDLDPASLQAGVAQQKLAGDPRVELIGGIDLADNKRLLERHSREPSQELFANILQRSAIPSISRLDKYDVVASICILSQLLGKVVACVEDRDEKFIELLKTVRRSHLNIIFNALNKGGTGILVTDFVSSDSLPDLLETTDLELTITTAIESNNYFHGLNPHQVARVLTESDFKQRLQTLDVTAPWRWVTALRVYACFALVFNVREGDDPDGAAI
jgi:hypothetical protein